MDPEHGPAAALVGPGHLDVDLEAARPEHGVVDELAARGRTTRHSDLILSSHASPSFVDEPAVMGRLIRQSDLSLLLLASPLSGRHSYSHREHQTGQAGAAAASQ